MKNIVIVFAILCCIGTTYFCLAQIKKQQKLIKVLADFQYEYSEKQDSKDFKLATLKEDMITCYTNEGEMLNDSIVLFEDGTEKVFLFNVIDNKTLIIRLSQLNCQVCVVAFMPLLHKLSHKKIFFLIDYTNKRYFDEFKKTCNANHRFFKIESLPTSLDTLNIPYFFLLDKNLKMDCVFVPHKEMIEQTEKYLEIVNNKIAN